MSKFGTYSNAVTSHSFKWARAPSKALEVYFHGSTFIMMYQQLCASTLEYTRLVCRRMEHIILQIKCHLHFGEERVPACITMPTL